MSKIAVIVPVYNVEAFLERCIESVLNQSFADIKLILINDGSTDNSREICKTYEKADTRIKLIEQENMGLSVARNKGLEESDEKYVYFLNSDDYIHRETLNVLYENLIENDADISIADYEEVYAGQRFEYKEIENNIRTLNNIEAVEKIVVENNPNMIVAWGKLYTRELFNEIGCLNGKHHEDEFVTYKLLYRAKKIVKTSAKLYYYTLRERDITEERENLKSLEKLEGLKEAITFFEEQDKKELKIHARYRYLLNLQIVYYKSKIELSCEKLAIKSLKRDFDIEFKKFKGIKEVSLIKRLKLRLFYIFPDLYCYLDKNYISSKDKDKG